MRVRIELLTGISAEEEKPIHRRFCPAHSRLTEHSHAPKIYGETDIIA